MRIGYVISTNVDYLTKTTPKLLASLEKLYVPREDITIFVGRHTHYLDKYLAGSYRTIYLPYGAYEKTALIGATEVDLPYTHVFLLHDTCEAGPRFHELVQEHTAPDKDMTVTFSALCDFGAYKVDFLKRVQPYLNSLKEMNKFTAIEHEGSLYRRGMGTSAVYPNDGCNVLGYDDVYKTGVMRMIEHYTAVDLYKYKANHGQTHQHNYVEQP